MDVREEANVEAAVTDALDRVGRIDTLANNAGIVTILDPIEMDELIDTNLKGPSSVQSTSADTSSTVVTRQGRLDAVDRRTHRYGERRPQHRIEAPSDRTDEDPRARTCQSRCHRHLRLSDGR
ncbi:SDR family NAD(P)-dependent oxidoreductase [Natrialbaceae archaeon GCM10025810]|uniref:SDR family NAD(P)-dependent oxidoreductase n=1 Tax=Halovalidus salilacus TaxID=3075124 RepID=UPI0036114BE3